MANHIALIVILFLSCQLNVVSAQQLTIQQPMISQFSAATAVVVPDRGSAFVAGIGRSATTSTSFGPLHRGSSIGNEVSHGSIQTSVYIHDFEEMDRQLLQQAELETPQYTFRHKTSASAYHSHRLSKTIPTSKTPLPAKHTPDAIYSLDQLRQDLNK